MSIQLRRPFGAEKKATYARTILAHSLARGMPLTDPIRSLRRQDWKGIGLTGESTFASAPQPCSDGRGSPGATFSGATPGFPPHRFPSNGKARTNAKCSPALAKSTPFRNGQLHRVGVTLLEGALFDGEGSSSLSCDRPSSI